MGLKTKCKTKINFIRTNRIQGDDVNHGIKSVRGKYEKNTFCFCICNLSPYGFIKMSSVVIRWT